MKKPIVQAISGGMDSTCLLIHHLATGHSVHLMSFDYEQKHRLELERLDANLEYLKSVDLGDRFTHHRVVLPLGAFVDSALLSASEDEVPTGF